MFAAPLVAGVSALANLMLQIKKPGLSEEKKREIEWKIYMQEQKNQHDLDNREIDIRI